MELVYLQRGRSKTWQYPLDNSSAHVSHETIYAAIYAQPRGGLKTAMIEALRQAKPARGLPLPGSACLDAGEGAHDIGRLVHGTGIVADYPPP